MLKDICCDKKIYPPPRKRKKKKNRKVNDKFKMTRDPFPFCTHLFNHAVYCHLSAKKSGTITAANKFHRGLIFCIYNPFKAKKIRSSFDQFCKGFKTCVQNYTFIHYGMM